MEIIEGAALRGPLANEKAVECAGRFWRRWMRRTARGSRIAI
jgi:hypothetical protein